MVVDTVNGQQIDIGPLQPGERIVEIGEELPRVGQRLDLGLHDDLLARHAAQQRAELQFRRAIAAGGLEVVDAQFEGPPERGLQIGLVVGGNVAQRQVLPLVLARMPPQVRTGKRISVRPKRR